jgi:hypothetical protein
MMQRIPDIQRQQIIANTLLNASQHIAQGPLHFLQTLKVAQTGDYRLVFW